MSKENQNILYVDSLRTYFFTRQGAVKAVDGVTFSIEKGESVGLVGESGCGKSMTGLSILRLVPKPGGEIVGGRILYKNEDLLQKGEEEMRRIRGDRISMILQDPMVALNQLLKVGYQLAEPTKYHRDTEGSLQEMCIKLLKRVKVPSPEIRVKDFPFQFSGGMCQRVLIAIAISCQPDLLIADEPTTALDVTIQAQILSLLKEIQREFNTSILLITHDLAIVAQICHRVMVMYAGRIIEKSPIRPFFKNPAHPYSIGLIRSVPVLRRRVERLYSIEGQPPSLLNLPSGCHFAPRCKDAMSICHESYPPEISLEQDHSVSCWLYSLE